MISSKKRRQGMYSCMAQQKRVPMFILLTAILLVSMLMPLSVCADTAEKIVSTQWSYTDAATGNKAIISDDAELGINTAELRANMQTCLKDSSVIAATTGDSHEGSTADRAEALLSEITNKNDVREDNTVIFLIDLSEREIYIYAGAYADKTITKSKCLTIAENVYTYATEGDYATCAEEAFSQIASIYAGIKISQPMRFICAILTGAFAGLLIGCAIFIKATSRKRVPKEILTASEIHFYPRITGSRTIPTVLGIFFCGGGSGSGSGSGSGRRFGRGGRHRF